MLKRLWNSLIELFWYNDDTHSFKLPISPCDSKSFSKTEEFCSHCLTHSYWFTGGGSWSPDRCPNHPNSDDVIMWKNMTNRQRWIAKLKFDKMWMATFYCHYFEDLR